MNALLLALALSAQPGSADDVVAKAFAEPAAASAPASESSAGSRMFGWALALCAAAAVVAMALKRKGQKSEAGFAEIAQNVSVGPKRSLLVVHFGGQRMLVGSTEAGFSVLSTQPLDVTEIDALIAEAAKGHLP
jgi:flagellar biogenesis protein FliO